MKQVNFAAGGFLHLRLSGRTYASKLLVRPVIETVIVTKAILNQRGLLFRLAFTEMKKEEKLLSKASTETPETDRQIAELERTLIQQDPTYPIDRKIISIRDLAEAAGLLDVYETSYSLYCKYSHGALIAVVNHLDQVTDEIDTETVVWGVIETMDILRHHTPAVVPPVDDFKRRLLKFRSGHSPDSK